MTMPVLTFLMLFPHPDPSDLPDRSLDVMVMSTVTPCHVPQTVTSDVPSTLTCYSIFQQNNHLYRFSFARRLLESVRNLVVQPIHIGLNRFTFEKFLPPPL